MVRSAARVHGSRSRNARAVARLTAGVLLLAGLGIPSPAVADPSAGIDPSAVVGATTQADFNGDGYADLVIGVPELHWGLDEDPPPPGFIGALHVVYGSADGLANTSTYLDKRQFPAVAGATPAAGADATVAGDFNGDGLSDLAVSSNLGVNGRPGAGAVYVLHGSRGGLSANTAEVWSQASGGIAGAPEAGDSFGASLAAGDLGHGPQSDLVIGVPGEVSGGPATRVPFR